MTQDSNTSFVRFLILLDNLKTRSLKGIKSYSSVQFDENYDGLVYDDSKLIVTDTNDQNGTYPLIADTVWNVDELDIISYYEQPFKNITVRVPKSEQDNPIVTVTVHLDCEPISNKNIVFTIKDGHITCN